MKNKNAKKIKRARERMEQFSAKGDDCPICKKDFRRGCNHSIKQAKDKLFERYIRAISCVG